MPIQAVTFDLWDTLVVDDSDEAERSSRGLRSKAEERRHATCEALRRHHQVTFEDVRLAYDVTEAAYRRVWREQCVTWTVPERLAVLLDGLGLSLPEADLEELVAVHERMEVEIPPRPIAGAAECLAELRRRGYPLCVVSDALVTPGKGLRRIMERHGLARHFDAFVFSDEVGRSKPHPRVFEAAAEALAVPVESLAHVGDRQHNDITGAQLVGARAVLFVGANQRDRAAHTADALCASLAELPDIIDNL